jgi:hypothetical protein
MAIAIMAMSVSLVYAQPKKTTAGNKPVTTKKTTVTPTTTAPTPAPVVPPVPKKEYDTIFGKWTAADAIGIPFPEDYSAPQIITVHGSPAYVAHKKKLFKKVNGQWVNLIPELKDADKDFSNAGIRAVCLDEDGKSLLIAGTGLKDKNNRNCIWKYDGVNWSVFVTPPSPSFYGIAMVRSGKDLFVFGSYIDEKGYEYAAKIEADKTFKPLGLRPDYGPYFKLDQCLFEADASGNVFIGLRSGNNGEELDDIIKWDGSTWTKLDLQKKYPHYVINKMYATGENKLLIIAKESYLTYITWENGNYGKLPYPSSNFNWLENADKLGSRLYVHLTDQRGAYGSKTKDQVHCWDGNTWQNITPRDGFKSIETAGSQSENKGGVTFKIDNKEYGYDPGAYTLLERVKKVTEDEINKYVWQLSGRYIAEYNKRIADFNVASNRFSSFNPKTYSVSTYKRTLSDPLKKTITPLNDLISTYSNELAAFKFEGDNGLYNSFSDFMKTQSAYLGTVYTLTDMFESTWTERSFNYNYKAYETAKDAFDKSTDRLNKALDAYEKTVNVQGVKLNPLGKFIQ